MTKTNTLVEQLGSKTWPTRRQAYTTLRQQGTDATEALLEGLKHTNWQVRKNCAALLDHVADERCAKPLAKALKDPIMDVRRHALHALVCDRCKTVPLDVDAVALISECALNDTSIRIRRKATTQLGILPTRDPRLLTVLHQLRTDKDKEIRRRANWSLDRLQNRRDHAFDPTQTY